MMRRITPHEALLISALAFLSFIPFYQLVVFEILTFDQFTNVAHSYMLGAALTVFLQWFPGAYRAFRNGYKSGADMLSVAVVTVMAALIYIRVYAMWKFNALNSSWIDSSFLVPLAPWVLGGALVLKIFAPGTQEGEIPLRNYGWFMFAGLIGALVSGISIGYSLGLRNITQ